MMSRLFRYCRAGLRRPYGLFSRVCKPDPTMTAARERERRKKWIDAARATVELDGMGIKLSCTVEEFNRRYIAGEIDGDEYLAAILRATAFLDEAALHAYVDDLCRAAGIDAKYMPKKTGPRPVK